MRALAIGEGANLGVTQRGRIAYALRGGRLNTDSIDNSAGVDCSDHEVNIKILLDAAIAEGKLPPADRNALLVQMTDEVGLLVLRDNYLQALAISLADSKGTAALDAQGRLLRMLEKSGRLNRAVEFLPDDEALAERAAAKKGLTRPENAILLSHAKLWLYEEILPSDLPDAPYLERDLIAYFPKALGEKFRAAARAHRLRREIVATSVTNALVNRAGATFVPELVERTGIAAHLIARAFVIARETFALDSLWAEIEALDGQVPVAAQMAMLHDINGLGQRATLWFLRLGRPDADIAATIAEYRDDIAVLAAGAEKLLPEHYARDLGERAARLVALGAPEPLARRVAGLVNLYSAGDVIRLSRESKRGVAEAAGVYYAVGTRFRLGRLRAACETMDSGGHWQKLAVGALVEEIFGHQLALADQVLKMAQAGWSPAAALERWLADFAPMVAQAEAILAELWAAPIDDLAQVAVASRQLRALAEATGPKG